MSSSAPLFLTTQWSLIRRAADPSDPDNRAALEELCRACWYPVYAFIRKSGFNHDDACDLAQDFFSRLLSNDHTLASLAPEHGRFRSFLVVAIKRLIASEWRKHYSQKRGRNITFSIDAVEADQRFRAEPADDVTPEVLFDRKWAAEVMDRTLRRLETHWRERDKPLEVLKTYLIDPRGTVPVTEVAEQLGVTVPSVKAAIYRMRRLFADLLREELSGTVTDPADVDDELRYLLTVLTGG